VEIKDRVRHPWNYITRHHLFGGSRVLLSPAGTGVLSGMFLSHFGKDTACTATLKFNLDYDVEIASQRTL
jgi:hypothetical protein